VTTTVRLLRYPVELGMSTVEHVEDWVREFKLMALAREDGSTPTHDVPARLQAMVDMLTRRYGAELSEPDRVRAAAAARGQATVDLVYTARDGVEGEEAVRGWQAMLAEVDEYCRAEDLLTLQRTPEQVRLQDWVCDEFLRQLRGEPPRPWTPRPAVAAVPSRDGRSAG
jgi:hypothetical protein